MRAWRRSLDIKQFLGSDESPEAAVAVGKKIGEYLKAHLSDYDNYDDFFDIENEPRKWRNAALNQALSRLYDWADEERVWLGL